MNDGDAFITYARMRALSIIHNVLMDGAVSFPIRVVGKEIVDGRGENL